MIFFGLSFFQKNVDVHFWEAECVGIDSVNKKVNCRSTQNADLDKQVEFAVDYDYLVIAIGARSNTFNVPGVEENAYFLKVNGTHNSLTLSYQCLQKHRIVPCTVFSRKFYLED